ncbi:DivIVA domain-containing protein [Actinacidiphila sp. SB3-2]
MFWFLLVSLVVVIAAVTLAVVGSGDGPRYTASGGLAEAPPDLLDEPLPPDRPVARADVDGLRLAVGLRGYRMEQVDDVLDRLGAELAERDARIAELESALAGAQAAAMAQDTRVREAAQGKAAGQGGHGSHPAAGHGAEQDGTGAGQIQGPGQGQGPGQIQSPDQVQGPGQVRGPGHDRGPEQPSYGGEQEEGSDGR